MSNMAFWAPIQSVINWAAPTQLQKVTSSDIEAADNFGSRVAIQGNTAIIGASNENSGTGAAYVFTRSGSTWSQQAKLTTSDGVSGDHVGVAVALDGDTAVIGGDTIGYDTGAVYVFTRSGSTWTQRAKLTASDAAQGKRFGSSVAIDGNTILVGSIWDSEFGDTSGSAYVFTGSGSTWTQQAKLTASDATSYYGFGTAVSIEGDTAAIGSYGVADYAGAAYIFTRSGGVWTEQAILAASDKADYDVFGISLQLNGGSLLVGAMGIPEMGTSTGAAYVFTGSGSSWTQQAKLTASDGALGDAFGYAVSLKDDIAVIGALQDDDGGTDSGSAYVFSRSGSTWTQVSKLTASDAAAGDLFGFSTGLDDNTVLVSAQGDDGAGSAYFFTP